MVKTSALSMVTNHFGREDFLWNLFTDRFLTESRHRMYSFSWDTDDAKQEGWRRVKELEERAEELFVNEGSGRLETFMVSKGLLIYLTVSFSGHVGVTIGAGEEGLDAVRDEVKRLKQTYPEVKVDDPRAVRMTFWMNGPRGPVAVRRTITVPSWEEILENYASDTRESLAGVMNGFKPAHGGQLMLWHGRPGAGKTFALRALALHWRDWCKVECVVDPEAFFGDANYMMSVLLDNDSGGGDMPAVAFDGEGKDLSPKIASPWRLLILEDAGELLSEDARQRTGQGLSRMLNLADGLIGQGMKVLILVTTNEPLKKLHPAVSRPGRCASEVEFTPLSLEEATSWLERRGLEAEPGGLVEDERTLAQLFGRAENFSGARGGVSRKLGFRT